MVKINQTGQSCWFRRLDFANARLGPRWVAAKRAGSDWPVFWVVTIVIVVIGCALTGRAAALFVPSVYWMWCVTGRAPTTRGPLLAFAGLARSIYLGTGVSCAEATVAAAGFWFWQLSPHARRPRLLSARTCFGKHAHIHTHTHDVVHPSTFLSFVFLSRRPSRAFWAFPT